MDAPSLLQSYLPRVLWTFPLIQDDFLLTIPGRSHLHFYVLNTLIIYPIKSVHSFNPSLYPDVRSPSRSFKIIFSASSILAHVSLNSYRSQCLYFCNLSTSFRLIWIFTTLLHICTECLPHGEWTLLRDMDYVIDIFYVPHHIAQFI